MCGIAGIFGNGWAPSQLEAMIHSQQHRGPDASGSFLSASGRAGLGHNRLSIIDLSAAGRQPMSNHDGSVWIAFNGEIYNYLELRAELRDYPYRSQSDTEVILAAYEKWGEACLERFIGMFALLIWDERRQRLFAARDRFGVKPLYYTQRPDGPLLLASEIKALHKAGVRATPNEAAWATYLAYGLYEHSAQTFWQDIAALPPGHTLTWQDGQVRVSRWYDLAARVGPEFDPRPVAQVQEEYFALLRDSVQLRFRSDVPVGINLSGGLDSSTLLGMVHAVQGEASSVRAFTFNCGDPRYDELPWVEQMLARTQHPLTVCTTLPAEVPDLAAAVQAAQDEPFGGLPTLAYAKLFAEARAQGVIVLLDGQGMDEQWAGYDYYRAAFNGGVAATVQGTQSSPVRPACLLPEFRARAQAFTPPQPFPDKLRNLQYRDACFTKIPRGLRFNDRNSMRVSTELREPFLDHRLVELALRQPLERKINAGTHKWLLRRLTREMLPHAVVEAPKRPVQTPQREWLRGPLRDWANDCITTATHAFGGAWLDRQAINQAWEEYCERGDDNSFYVWQWLNLGLLSQRSVQAVGSSV
ncbi:MAG: asparagine synthase (glutamine-hydrolyzing) [Acidobacteria bacterium]|nr:asparagine synthase (glutamine-hydrolyzing) [Acidobacteriota bacterium]MBI3425538.1 asparagine synthase (glutamine-hydrolyzing) [Acidobacteriota bacterium]